MERKIKMEFTQEDVIHIIKHFQGAFVNIDKVINIYIQYRVTPWTYVNTNPFSNQREIELSERMMENE